MVLDLTSASYIGWPNPAFVIRSFDTARVVQGERRAELARAIQILPLDLGRFSARI